MTPPDVALMGKAGAGKDFTARLLQRGWGHRRVALADPVRDAALALNPVVGTAPGGRLLRLADVLQRYGWDVAKYRYPEIRRLLQRLGTEVGRDIVGPDIWLRIAARRVEALRPAPVVITDVRFPNEVAWCAERGFRLVWVERPEHLRACIGANATHATETSVGPADAEYTIINDADAAHIIRCLEKIISG